MKHTSDLEMDVVRLAGNLPQGTVIIAAKHGTMKLHCVMRDAEVGENILKEAQELYNLWTHNPEDDK